MKYSNPGADFPCGVETGSAGSNPVLNARLNINNFQGYSLIGITNPTQRVSTRVGRSTQYNISLIGSKYLVREIAGSTPVYYILVN